MDVVIGAIGFTAYATADIIFDPPETVIFDGVVSNYGGAYDSMTGVFTCPVTGQDLSDIKNDPVDLCILIVLLFFKKKLALLWRELQ